MESSSKKKNNEKREKEYGSFTGKRSFHFRNTLCGSDDFEKKRVAILGFLFLKFAGDKFQKQREKIKAEYGDDNVFYLPEESRWNYIVDHASDNDIAVKLDTAMEDNETKNTELMEQYRKGFIPLLRFQKKR